MNNFPVQGFMSGVEHGQGHLVSFEDPESQIGPLLAPEMGPEPLFLPHGPAFVPFPVSRPVNLGFLDPTLVHQAAAAVVPSLGPHAIQNLVALGVLPRSHSFRGVSAGPFPPGVPSLVAVGPAGSPLAPLVSSDPTAPTAPTAAIASAASAQGYEKRTKGYKRPEQPHRRTPPSCEEPTTVKVKLSQYKDTAKDAGKVIEGVNPNWTGTELKQHFELQAILGGIPAEKQALRLDRPAAPGFDSAMPLDDVVVLKEVGIDRGTPACVVWLERRMESGGPGVPAPAVATAGAPTGLLLPTRQQQLLPSPTGNDDRVYQHQIQLRHQQQVQQQVQQHVLPEKNTVNSFHGPILRPGQLRGGGTGAMVGEGVGLAGQGASRQAGSVDPAILRQRLVLRERRRSNHHHHHQQQQQQQQQHHHRRQQLKQQQEQQLKQQHQYLYILPAETNTSSSRQSPSVTPGPSWSGSSPFEGGIAVTGLEARLLAWQNGASATGVKQPQQQQQPEQQQEPEQQQSYAAVSTNHVGIGIGIGIDVDIGDDDDYYDDSFKISRESDVSAIINGSRILTQRQQRQQRDQQQSLAAAAVNQNDLVNSNYTEEDIKLFKEWTIGVWPDDDESAS